MEKVQQNDLLLFLALYLDGKKRKKGHCGARIGLKKEILYRMPI